MPVVRLLINGDVPIPVVAPPPPAVPLAPPPPPLPLAPPPYFLLNPVAPAPPPPVLAPASSGSAISPELLAAAGVTQAQVDEANAAAAYAAAGATAILAGGGSIQAAAAEAAAGAPESVVQAVLDLGIPDLTSLVVTGTDGSGDTVGGTDDLAAVAALANANRPDLSDLGGFDVFDAFGDRTLAAANPPLKGGGALAAIAQACSDYGVDAIAAIADALHEGANGGIGDGGKSYGPFQMEIGGALPAPYSQHGLNNPVTNAWAWSTNGIRYAVRGMVSASPSARGLRGHAAVYAIVYGFERPADKPGAYKTRAAEYDHLVKLGSGWAVYAADLFKGPIGGGGVDSKPITGGGSAVYHPAGVTAQWRGLVDVFKTDVPKQHSKVNSLAKSFVEVFR